MDNAGAGAVARAMLPNTNARETGTSKKAKIKPNARLTTANVPRDCVSVVITRAFP